MAGFAPLHRITARLLLVGLIALSALVSIAIPGAARAATPDAPAALQTETVAGPWRLTVQEVVTGDEANALVGSASAANLPLAEGLSYVAARLTAMNAGSATARLESGDFAVADTSGIVHLAGGATAPDPALAGPVEPGASLEGWVVGAAANDAAGLILLYDSLTLTGDWADAAFALTDGAALTPAAARAVELNRVGRDHEDAAGFNTPVATRDWVVELIEVVQGEAVADLFPASDYRTTALLGGSTEVAATWLAFRVKITNNRTGLQPAYLAATAFTLADSAGDPNPDLSWLTPPFPDAAGGYFPGASREGWVLFDLATPLYTPDASYLRFLPNRTDDDARYFTWGGGGATVPAEPSFEGTLETGAKVVTTEDLVRLRESPSTEGEIVADMAEGTELTVTGAPEEGDGFTWYPVEDPETGDEGYVVAQFIEPAD
ncbi:MAG: SH3 domain-containing protein [Thermomicrobiales bacterium]|nr:SH3 domain-containing protein [Thermomicrobiales bacterium]